MKHIDGNFRDHGNGGVRRGDRAGGVPRQCRCAQEVSAGGGIFHDPSRCGKGSRHCCGGKNQLHPDVGRGIGISIQKGNLDTARVSLAEGIVSRGRDQRDCLRISRD